MQAAHGQAFVVAASHLILRRRQPSHALITVQVSALMSTWGPREDAVAHLSIACAGCVRPQRHSLHMVVSLAFPGALRLADSLRWFSRGASVGGAKVKLCIWAVCGSSGRPAVSPGMSGIRTAASGDKRWWCSGRRMAAGSSSAFRVWVVGVRWSRLANRWPSRRRLDHRRQKRR